MKSKISVALFLSASSSFAGVCDEALPSDPRFLGQTHAYECSAPGSAGDVCVVEYKTGNLQIAFPNVPRMPGHYGEESSSVQDVPPGESSATWELKYCLGLTNGLPFYDEERCKRWTTTKNTVSFDRAAKSILIDYSFKDSGQKKNNKTAQFRAACTLSESFEEKLVASTKSTLLMDARGDLRWVSSVHAPARAVVLQSLSGAKKETKSYSELGSYVSLGLNDLFDPMSKTGVITPDAVNGKTFLCVASSGDGKTLRTENGIARIHFDSVPRRENELKLVSSLKVSVATSFQGRETLPVRAKEGTLFDSNEGTFFLVARAGGVDYSRAMYLDSANSMRKFGVSAETFVMDGSVCFRD